MEKLFSSEQEKTQIVQTNHDSPSNNFKIIFISFFFLLVGGVGGYLLGAKNQLTPQSKYLRIDSAILSPTIMQKEIATSPPTILTATSSSNCQLRGYNGQPIGTIIDYHYCKVSVPIEDDISYEVTYLRTWTLRLAGAAGVNLSFNEIWTG